MTLTDLLDNRFTRIIGTLAALALPAGLACEADEGTTNNYYSENGGSNSTPSSFCVQLFQRADYCCNKIGGKYPEYCPSFLSDAQSFYSFCEQESKNPAQLKEMKEDLSYGNCCRVVTINDGAPMCTDSGTAVYL